MYRLFLASILLGVICTSSFAQAPPFVIAGYLPEYRSLKECSSAIECLTDLYLFSAEATASGGLDTRRLAKVEWKSLTNSTGRRNLLCIGGWNRSTHLPTLAASPEMRTRFANAVQELCLEKHLDGVDIDWEHPKTDLEVENYGKLLAELKRTLKDKRVSVTLAAWQKVTPAMMEAVDLVQVMAYDHPGRHSTLENAQADISKLLDAGVPAKKLVMGIPLYGRDVKKFDRVMTYAEIVRKFQPAADVDEVKGIYFNGKRTVKRKVEWAKQQQLAGVMVWELGQDVRGDASLMQVLR